MGIPTTKVSFKAPTFRRLRIKIALKSKFSNCYPADNKRGRSDRVLTKCHFAKLTPRGQGEVWPMCRTLWCECETKE